jgi:hypothetical protein
MQLQPYDDVYARHTDKGGLPLTNSLTHWKVMYVRFEVLTMKSLLGCEDV